MVIVLYFLLTNDFHFYDNEVLSLVNDLFLSLSLIYLITSFERGSCLGFINKVKSIFLFIFLIDIVRMNMNYNNRKYVKS